jgi:heterodisulfide reductase subunit A-like polyferredoxin
MEKDPQLSVTETNVEGIFLAGAVQQPMHSYQTVVHASAAALKAMSVIQKEPIPN